MRTPNPNSIASRIVMVFDLNPTLSSYQIATLCGVEANYVRRVLGYRGRKLFRSRKREARKRSSDQLPNSAA